MADGDDRKKELVGDAGDYEADGVVDRERRTEGGHGNRRGSSF
eukprot:CAMPEP_0167831466 /NCGR_PEP_ID=MMETSP0112_2-20121227/13655_1 /TAXON_ID=91324 /ORGANISM="Lotharella globosa, Strain CCCM811" /LENGTH=42 /DNA_ID= /DNA_START= /DNA_END= /DNA_ORIENTATION=